MKPSGYHSAPGPSLSTRPATPRNAAAPRYSPEIAAAFAVGRTVREATRKSDVLRAVLAPKKLMMAEASTNSAIRARAHTAPASTTGTP